MGGLDVEGYEERPGVMKMRRPGKVLDDAARCVVERNAALLAEVETAGTVLGDKMHLPVFVEKVTGLIVHLGTLSDPDLLNDREVVDLMLVTTGILSDQQVSYLLGFANLASAKIADIVEASFHASVTSDRASEE